MYIRIKQIFFIILTISSGSVFADSAIQTNWSGGDGVLGPVSNWSDVFSSSSLIEFEYQPGSIMLEYNTDRHTVGDIIGNYENELHSADIDSDGDLDIVSCAVSFGTDEIVWWENADGSGTEWIKKVIEGGISNAQSVFPADIDGDNDIDVLGSFYPGSKTTDNGVVWWENSDGFGTSWILHTIDEEFDLVEDLYTADIDGDSDTDVLGASRYGYGLCWWENTDGAGTTWTKRANLEPYGIEGFAVCTTDIDGDGDVDVLFSGSDCYGLLNWYENLDGSGMSWASHSILSEFWPRSLSCGDLDDDADIDILAAGYNGCMWLENSDGIGTSWIEHEVSGDFTGNIGDINGDGYLDIACKNPGNGISWWCNSSAFPGEYWTQYLIDSELHLPFSICIADLNNDNLMDIVSSDSDEDGIFWWDLDGYTSGGSLESSILDTQCSPQWASIDWSSSEPAGTDLYFQYKTSDDPGSMGGWSDPIYEPCFLSGLLDRYFQYKVLMETDDPGSTPKLNDLTLNWDPLGVGDDPQVTVYLLHGAKPNPASGSVSIGFAVPELSTVELSIFDLVGRLVIAPAYGEYSPGVHQVQLDELAPGTYFCRMISGDFTANQRFVVIE